MIRWRLLTGVIGLVAILLALALTNAGSAPIEIAVTWLGNDYIFVGLLAVAAIGLGLLTFISRRSSNLRATNVPEHEQPIGARSPGADLDETIENWWIDAPFLGHQTRSQVRLRVREATIQAIMRVHGCNRTRALEAIETGTWTGNQRASEFVKDAEQSPQATLRRILGLFRPGTQFQRDVYNAINTVTEMSQQPAGHQLPEERQ